MRAKFYTKRGLSENLVEWFAFEPVDVSGSTVRGKQGLVTNLILTNGATTVAGLVGNELSLDGVNDYAIASSVDLGFNNATEIAISFRIKTTDTSGRIIQKQIVDGFNSYIVAVSASKIYFSVQNQQINQFPEWTTVAAINDGNSHHIMCSFKKNSINSNDVSIYIDGAPASTTFNSNGYNASFVIQENSNNLVIGARAVTFSDNLSGSVDEIRLYKKIPSAAVINALNLYGH